MSIDYKLDLIIKRLWEIERVLGIKDKTTTFDKETRCPKCGMNFSGTVSYYCVSQECPLFVKTITS